MSQYDFDILLKKYLEGNCTSREESIVLEWYQNLISESRLELTNDEKQAIENKIWAKVHSGINDYPDKTKKAPVFKFNPKIIYRVAVAACFVLLVGIGWYWFAKSPSLLPITKQVAINKIPNNYSWVSNDAGYEKNVLLSDGSLITLQPKSTLYYPSTFTGNTREVYLTGNAFFKIFHNPAKHFIVHIGGLLTEVLGTSFSITHNTKTNKIEVAVVTGKVSVYEQSKIGKVTADLLQPNSIILTPNQKVTYNSSNNQFITTLVEDPKPLVSTKPIIDTTGRFVFEEAPLSKVLHELTEIYGIEINTEPKNLDNCHFTGDITMQDLYKKLDIICQSTCSSYEVKGTVIIIKGKGCN
jgi:transmembrane sensor